VTDVNVFELALQEDDDDPDGYHVLYQRLAPLVGGERLGLSVYELPPGQSVCPYHYETGEEEWLLVLTGRVTVRTPEGETELGEWDTVFFPPGEDGAHKATNRGEQKARIAIWSNRMDPHNSVYPDSGKVGAWPPGKLFRLGDAVEYFDGELDV
jgi:uncharacterized cupin superfamily protein